MRATLPEDAPMPPTASAALPFNPPYAEDDKAIAARPLAHARPSPERERRADPRDAGDTQPIAARLVARPRPSPGRERRVDQGAARLIEAIRAKGGGLGGVE